MSRARTSGDIWWARIFDRLDEFLHNYPKLPKNSVTESSLPLHIGSKVTINNYNTFLHNYGSSGYKFRFQLNSDNTTGEVYIIDMASHVHERITTLLQDYFKVPNNGVFINPPILVDGQVLHYVPRGNGVEVAPDACVSPGVAFVPKPTASTVIPRPPGNTCGNPHARIMCEVAVGQSVGELGRKCLSWMREPYVRAVISIKILEPRLNMQEPTTGYYYRTMTAKLYRQGMLVQRWDFGNIKKHSRDPVNDPPGCNAPNLAAYQITLPISEVFWDPPYPIPPGYTPAIPPNVVGINFVIDLYQIQRVALQAQTP
ncbi:unnamed protein product [Rhizophagus irregularis]|nr:hypothetical protein GLOIN_2v1734856 [Rhizophagus irregularis DAOM 181602=DAOM 197198]POG57982.1 hypothetical protein GLOIN_2v1734856 [Rhizophagus irregularis DAOM 181602=DAOM 197198]CAB4384986.1 unnamed protein product [Rhizophagus irregularis]CAB4486890.1 unnamed protein product [Rhizophagus irregularis]CAB5312064.1 unnamed protein product [Rhizophagus irregularis]|eukprot:XP_025164848.1 hypothetical protein GLOIN_2v1734856 [Rhizophagus irregularis DAOM 181602=DAOM 197198]